MRYHCLALTVTLWAITPCLGSNAMEAAIAKKRATLLEYQNKLGYIQIHWVRRLEGIGAIWGYEFEWLVGQRDRYRTIFLQWHEETGDFTAYQEQFRNGKAIDRAIWDRTPEQNIRIIKQPPPR